jgi:hypothetical protein
VAIDPSTGNRRPGAASVDVSCRGVLQQRQLPASSVDAGSSEISDGHVVMTYVLMLEPSAPTPSSRAVLLDEDDNTYQVVASPRVRKPVGGRPVYIAVMVRRSSDMKE